MRWLPGLASLRQGSWADVSHDLIAGLGLTAVLLPVGVAYAVASGLPAVQGLYASMAALLAYALFGPSRVLVLGPDSSLVALLAAVVLPLSGGQPERAVALAGAVALVAGAVCLAAGLARLGFVTELLSKPIRQGYLHGIALTVLVSQLPALLGFSVHADGLLDTLRQVAHGALAGRVNAVALALGMGTLAVLLLSRRHPRVPGVLLAVLGATALVAVLGLDRRADVPVLGPLLSPSQGGLPLPSLALLRVDDIGAVLAGGLAIALVALADTSVLSRSYATRRGEAVDANQEALALGAANLAAGLLQGMPVSASASRSAVAEAAGARSQRAGVVGALAVAVLLAAAPDALRHLPATALAAVVIASALSLIDVAELRRIHRMQPWEFWLAVGCLAGVALLGAPQGIALAVGVALVEFVWDAWRPHSAVLGAVPGLRGYHDTSRHADAIQPPGLLILRWDAPLFFANAEQFRQRVTDALAAAPHPVRWLVIGAEPVTRIDVTAADMLDELHAALAATGITLCLAELKGPVKDELQRYGLLPRVGGEHLFRTLEEAVEHGLVHLRDEPGRGGGAGKA